MPRYTVVMNLKIDEHSETRVTSQGPQSTIVASTTYSCGADARGEDPSNALAQVMERLVAFMGTQTKQEQQDQQEQ